MATPRREKAKPSPICVRIQPTIGPPFTLSVPSSTKISNLKESISDRMGLSPQKMTLLLHSCELQTGTLLENSIEDGAELRLVPAVESGVTSVNSVDPVAMMKHSMSGISDQQIDDFLNGKSPLSVAIRVGESVVVVNLHRAKIEEIEVEPPATKRRCLRTRRPSEESNSSVSPLSSPPPGVGVCHLNSNPSSSSFDTRERGGDCIDGPLVAGLRDYSVIPKEVPRPSSSRVLDSHEEPCCSASLSQPRSVSRSVQTDPEPSKKEIKLPETGVSMKRKAVMEAISEILKKMYANSEKGRLPGSFKGRFSSEFTCDSDMSEILHSKTTMTSYGSDMEDDKSSSSSDSDNGDPLLHENSLLSKKKFEENEQLRDKVAQLKWKMQQRRALKLAKRKGERSPCGWMEARNCEMPREPPKARERNGFCGLKRGFLLS